MKPKTLDEINKKLEEKNIPYICVEYNGKKKSIFYCPEHDHYFEKLFSNIISGKTWCMYDSEWKSTDWTKESISLYLTENNIPYKIIGNYHNLKTKTQFCCNEDHVFDEYLKNILDNKECCPICYGQDYIKNEINKKLEEKNIKYRLVGHYTNNSTETQFHCENHGEFDAKLANIMAGSMCCQQCQIDNNKVFNHSVETINNKLLQLNIPYELCDENTNVKKESLFHCKECNGYFTSIIDNIFTKHKKCPHCKKLNLLHLFLTNLEDKNIPYKLVGLYINNLTETQFYCEEHDNVFNAIPNGVLYGKHKCKKCHTKMCWNLELLNNHLKENNRLLVFHDFKTIDKKSLCECEKCNYKWEVVPSQIIHSNSGCPKCTPYSFNKDKPAILYYIKLLEYDLYKIGITNRTVEKRFHGEGINYDIIFSKEYEYGKEAKEFETFLLKQFKEYKYVGDKIMKKTGNREIFIKDIFDGDYTILMTLNIHL